MFGYRAACRIEEGNLRLKFAFLEAACLHFFSDRKVLGQEPSEEGKHAGMCIVHITLSGLSCQLMRISQTVD